MAANEGEVFFTAWRFRRQQQQSCDTLPDPFDDSLCLVVALLRPQQDAFDSLYPAFGITIVTLVGRLATDHIGIIPPSQAEPLDIRPSNGAVAKLLLLVDPSNVCSEIAGEDLIEFRALIEERSARAYLELVP